MSSGEDEGTDEAAGTSDNTRVKPNEVSAEVEQKRKGDVDVSSGEKQPASYDGKTGKMIVLSEEGVCCSPFELK